MNPLERKLRLRRTTVRNLSPDAASRAQGGTIDFDDNSLIWIVCSMFKCPEQSGDLYACTAPPPPPPSDLCASINYTNCIECPTEDPANVSCATEPHVGCCRI